MSRVPLLAVAVLLAAIQSIAGQEPSGGAVLLQVRGPIGPAISDFIERSVQRAAEDSAAAVILMLDTPGGLDTSMRATIKAIMTSPLPVVTYVAPSGSRAASAGTYILYASHVAAMAPATNLGAATPIPIGPGMVPGGGRGPRRADEDEAEPGAPLAPERAMQRKVLNDAVAYIRGLAELRGRNAEWAETAVREGASLSAEQALAEGVIDILAVDVDELVAALDGREVAVLGGTVTLRTAGWTIRRIEPDWRTEVLSVLTNPNVAYLLLLLGVYGLLFELYSPGAMVPGIIGAISLVFALYALHLLPVNYAGVALILIGIGLMAAELFTPSFGAIGAGGIGAFVVGSVMLFDSEAEGLAVSLPLVVSFSVAGTSLFVATVIVAARQRRRPVVTGREEMLGSVGHAVEAFEAEGHVRVHGEIWSARSSAPVATGQAVRITGIDGLILTVEPMNEET